MITDPCDSCDGEGRKRKNRNIEVSIPTGVDDGSRIRLSGEGEWAKGGQSGDLYVASIALVELAVVKKLPDSCL